MILGRIFFEDEQPKIWLIRRNLRRREEGFFPQRCPGTEKTRTIAGIFAALPPKVREGLALESKNQGIFARWGDSA